MCEFISQSHTNLSWSPLLALVLGNLRSDIWIAMNPMVTKEMCSDENQKDAFFVTCEFISQSYTLRFIEQFPNTIFLESAIG